MFLGLSVCAFLLLVLVCILLLITSFFIRNGDSVDNTVEENSSIFSLI